MQLSRIKCFIKNKSVSGFQDILKICWKIISDTPRLCTAIECTKTILQSFNFHLSKYPRERSYIFIMQNYWNNFYDLVGLLDFILNSSWWKPIFREKKTLIWKHVIFKSYWKIQFDVKFKMKCKEKINVRSLHSFS